MHRTRFRPRRFTRHAGHLGVLTLVAVMACASGRHATAQDDVVPDNVLALEIDNRNWSDILITVLHDGMRTRFAEVSATKSKTVAIPPELVGSNGTFRMIIHRIGGVDDYVTPVVSIRTGLTVNLTVESDLQRSSIGVW